MPSNPLANQLYKLGVSISATEAQTITPVNSLSEIPANANGVYRLPSGDLLSYVNGAKAQSGYTPVYQDTTPTRFFDPTASGSSGVGTFANPFINNTQLGTWITSLSGQLGGHVLGFKRGTTYTGNIALTSVTGLIGSPFIVTSYGLSSDRPIITGLIASTGWTPDPTYPQLWRKASAISQEIYHTAGFDKYNVHRFYSTATSTSAALAAAGPGYKTFVGGYLYIYPLDNTNPNLGQLKQTYLDHTITPNIFNITAANVVSPGYIDVENIEMLGCARELVSITVGGAATTSSQSINITNCEIGCAGGDMASSGASSAVVYFGKSDTVRLTGSIFSGNRIYNVINNAIEYTFADSCETSYNTSTRIGGKNIVELYGSNSNHVVKYNYGENIKQSTNYTPGLAIFGQNGIWQYGVIGGTSTPAPLTNVNNVFAFNYSLTPNYMTVRMSCGEGQFINNTFIGGYQNVQTIITIGDTGACDITLQNNLFKGSEFHGVNCFGLSSVNAGDVIRGNNNIVDWDTSTGGTHYTRFRNTQYNGSVAVAAAINAVTAGSQSNIQITRSATDAKGVPYKAKQMLAGKSLVNGVDGALVTGYTDGSFGYRTDINGNLLTNNIIGAIKP